MAQWLGCSAFAVVAHVQSLVGELRSASHVVHPPKKSTDNKCQRGSGGVWRKGDPPRCWWECRIGAATKENRMGVP